MKKFTFLLGFSIITSLGFSQVIVDLLSVPCNPSLEGTYDYELADLDGSATDWNSPDMTQSGNSVQAELVLVDDGTTPGTFVTPGDLTYESIHKLKFSNKNKILFLLIHRDYYHLFLFLSYFLLF